ncbi:hypothetical protein ABGN05_07670 [Aquibium sp. LZ166]|uniref:Uncharacterized protein n=1 Tax=Aquibium pacificus TaxID=3153579 RepID=A0ABV3SFK0_9HYPH
MTEDDDLPPPPEPQSESSLFAPLTAGGRDPVRDEYLRRVGHMAGTQPMTKQEISLPGMMRIAPPWKIG